MKRGKSHSETRKECVGPVQFWARLATATWAALFFSGGDVSSSVFNIAWMTRSGEQTEQLKVFLGAAIIQNRGCNDFEAFFWECFLGATRISSEWIWPYMNIKQRTCKILSQFIVSWHVFCKHISAWQYNTDIGKIQIYLLFLYIHTTGTERNQYSQKYNTSI